MTPNPQDVADRLAVLYRKHGRLTPAMVVEDARTPTSPLHAHFEWDDGEAAKRFREDQARALIRSIKVIIRTDTAEITSVAYVRDPALTSAEQGYVGIETLANDREHARQALRYECTRAGAMLERAREIALVLGLAGDVDLILAGLATVQEKAQEIA